MGDITMPMQPGLRSFIVYDQIDENCIAFEVTDRSNEPHFHAGDFALIDTADRAPLHGEMYLIQWDNGNRCIIEAVSREYTVAPREGGANHRETLWTAEFRNLVTSMGGGPSQNIRWFDGPYAAGYFETKIVGKVVGIYEPDFRASLSSQLSAG